MGWLGKAAGFLFGSSDGTSAVSKSLDLASEYVEDKDKKNELYVKLIEADLEAKSKSTIPWVDAIHKMGRQLMIFAIMIIYYLSWEAGKPIPLEEMMGILAGPGVYILMKGKGR